MRLKRQVQRAARVLIISVLASPGTPSSMQCPRLKKRNQQFLDDVVLADDHLGELLDDLAPRRAEFLDSGALAAGPAGGRSWGFLWARRAE